MPPTPSSALILGMVIIAVGLASLVLERTDVDALTGSAAADGRCT